MPLFETYTTGARAPLAALLQELSSSRRRVVVVHDRINAFADEEAARLPNGEAFGLHCLALSLLVGQIDTKLLRQNGLAFSGVEHHATKEFMDYARRARRRNRSRRALEGEFIDVVAGHLAADGKKIFAIGPLSPVLPASASKQRHECLGWLDKQPPASVLYVSFGTTSSLRDEQIEELAAALRDIKQRFIWVLRDADRGDIFAEAGVSRHEKLLSEFTKDTEGTGLVITGWALQLEILAHALVEKRSLVQEH